MVYKRCLQGDSSCRLGEDGAGPEMQQTGEVQTLLGRAQSHLLPHHMAWGALIQLSEHNCNQQSANCLSGKAPPLPCDSWFCNTGDALWEAGPALSAPWPRLEEGQKLVELVGTGDVSTLLTWKSWPWWMRTPGRGGWGESFLPKPQFPHL